jgi:hypothetical protein
MKFIYDRLMSSIYNFYKFGIYFGSIISSNTGKSPKLVNNVTDPQLL